VRAGLDETELGYRLRRSAWGKGYGTEGSRALIRAGFIEHGVERVVAETMVVHTASRRVMEKAGLTLVGLGFDNASSMARIAASPSVSNSPVSFKRPRRDRPRNRGSRDRRLVGVLGLRPVLVEPRKQLRAEHPGLPRGVPAGEPGDLLLHHRARVGIESLGHGAHHLRDDLHMRGADRPVGQRLGGGREPGRAAGAHCAHRAA